MQLSPKAREQALAVINQAHTTLNKPNDEQIQESRRAMGATLREIAEKENCECDFCPPYAFFGCVNFLEQQPNTWRISVLDDVAIEIIETVDATKLVTVALEIIADIEAVLGKTKTLAKVLTDTFTTFQSSCHPQFVSPNILMLLMSSDKSLKAHLTSADDLGRTRLSRAQMGYLVKALKQGHGLAAPLEISYSGATQHSTKESSSYLSLPSVLEPRKHPQATPISAINLVVKK